MFVLGIFFLSIFGILLLNGIQTFYKNELKQVILVYYIYILFSQEFNLFGQKSVMFFVFFLKKKRK